MHRAVLIANGTFAADSGLASLAGPTKDVRRLQEALTQSPTAIHSPDTVASVVDGSKREVMVTLGRLARECGSNDHLLVYFSGHGRLNLVNDLYLCAADTIASALPETGIWAREVNNVLRESRARCIVMILDCCHSGAFELRGGDLERAFPVPIDSPNEAGERTNEAVGRFLLASTGFEELGKDDSDGGPFTKYLVEALTVDEGDIDCDGVVSLEDAYRFIKRKMAAARLPAPTLNARRGGLHPALTRRRALGAAKQLYTLETMVGLWRNGPALYCGKMVKGALRIAYDLHGAGTITGEMMKWRIRENALTSMFRWVDKPIEGHYWLQLLSQDTAVGGWRFAQEADLEDEFLLTGDSSRIVAATRDVRWERDPYCTRYPDWADEHFARCEREGEG